MIKTLIRSDSGSKIGLGHIKRDLIYAKNLQNVSFACLNLDGNIINELPYKVHFLHSNSQTELIDLIKKEKFTHIVFDHYDINFEFEKNIKDNTHIHITSFDDMLLPHFCDILINTSCYAKLEDYKNLVPDNCKILVKVWLLRDEFLIESQTKREKIYDHFICFGGTDHKNLSMRIASDLIFKGKNSKIIIATTHTNSNLKELKTFAKDKLIIDSPNLARLMNESKLLHISASSIANEAIYLNAKFIAYKTAKNQELLFQYLKKNGVTCYDMD